MLDGRGLLRKRIPRVQPERFLSRRLLQVAAPLGPGLASYLSPVVVAWERREVARGLRAGKKSEAFKADVTRFPNSCLLAGSELADVHSHTLALDLGLPCFLNSGGQWTQPPTLGKREPSSTQQRALD